MGEYSKMFGSLIGGVAGLAVTFGLPEAWATSEIQGAIVILMATLFTNRFPANKPSE